MTTWHEFYKALDYNDEIQLLNFLQKIRRGEPVRFIPILDWEASEGPICSSEEVTFLILDFSVEMGHHSVVLEVEAIGELPRGFKRGEYHLGMSSETCVIDELPLKMFEEGGPDEKT